ncbi:MAG: ComEC/Rec2 family competence protein [Smithellaceae bacterium]
MRRPLLAPLFCVIAGILAGDFFYFDRSLLFSAILILALVLVLCFWNKYFRFAFIVFCGIIFVSSFLNLQKTYFPTHDPRHILHHANLNKLLSIEGVVIHRMFLAEKTVLTVRTARLYDQNTYTAVQGNLRLTVPADMSFEYGDFIRFHTHVNSIQTFRNPGGFDYKRYLNRQGIFAAGSVANESEIILLRKNTGGGFRYTIESFRNRLRKIITEHAETPSREIILAMTLGDSRQIPSEIRDIFAKTGTSHILAISGLHIGILGTAVFLLIILLMKSSEYVMLKFNAYLIASLGAFVMVIFYAFVAGMGTTVLRATLMAGAILFALIIGMPDLGIDATCLAIFDE